MRNRKISALKTAMSSRQQSRKRKAGSSSDATQSKRAPTATDDAHDSSEDGLRDDEVLGAADVATTAATAGARDDNDDDDDASTSFTADFDFFDAKDDDFHSVKLFLNPFADPAAHLNVSDLADAICSDTSVGNVVKVGNELLGFLVALPFAALSRELGAELRGVLLERVPAAHRAALTNALDSPKLGLIVSERMLNTPPQLVPPLHSMLFDELAATVEDGRPQFDFDQYLLLATSYRKAPRTLGAAMAAASSNATAATTAEVSAASGSASNASARDPNLRFHHFETNAYLNAASLHFSFPIKLLGQELRWTWQGNINPHTTVMLVPKPAVPTILAEAQEQLTRIEIEKATK